MAEGKNQHFVPQRYFRLFSQNGKTINTLIKSTGRCVFNASIRGQASKPWFYGDTNAEKAITDIENLTGPALQAFIQCNDFAELERKRYEQLQLWVLLQRIRTESSRQATADFENFFARTHLQVAVNSMSSEELGDFKKKELLEILPHLEVRGEATQFMRLRIAFENVALLDDLEVVILRNLTTKPFIFSDAPCIFHNVLHEKTKGIGVLGLKSVGLMIILPLNENSCALFYDPLAYHIFSAENGIKKISRVSDINALNSLQIHSSLNCIYFSRAGDQSYVKYLWELHQEAFTRHKLKEREIDLIDSTADRRHYLLLGYEPLLPVTVQLSFLKTHLKLNTRFYKSRDELRSSS